MVLVSDRIWPLKYFREFFDLFWSIKLYIAANGRLIKDLVSQVWSNGRISCLDPKQLSTNSCFVRDLIVTLGQSRLQVSFALHNSSWLGNQMVPNKLTKVGGIQTRKKCGKRDFPPHLAWRLPPPINVPRAHESSLLLKLKCSPSCILLINRDWTWGRGWRELFWYWEQNVWAVGETFYSFHGEILSKIMARTARRHLDGRHLLFGLY